MFAKALSHVQEFTFPVIYSRRHVSGQIASWCGTFIVVNPEGWILTASHIVNEIQLQDQHRVERGAYEIRKNSILSDSQLSRKAKEREIARLGRPKDWITESAILWGFPDARIQAFHGNHFADIAIGRLEPFDPSWVRAYPVFKNPAEPMLPGTSVCRLGFPFHQINATFNEKAKGFELAEGVLPIPRFPNDGIHTRIANLVSPDGKYSAKFLETSTPGLRGQSGGPIFDQNGHVWALQSRTQSLPLGFSPEISDGNHKVVEHQFMNIGWGSHVEEIITLFNMHGVSFNLSSASDSTASHTGPSARIAANPVTGPPPHEVETTE
jgi:hypothetical protein